MQIAQLAGATEKQQNFILDLIAQREYVFDESFVIDSPKEASELIGELLKAPFKTGVKKNSPSYEALSKLPKSNYAIPVSEVELDFLSENINTEYLFVVVSEFKGTVYLRRLHGSVGSFTRSKMSKQDNEAIVRVLSADPYKYAKIFGTVYSRCAKCGAELTDDTSRSLMLGPVCRVSFGF